MNEANFDESKHNRANDGKFSSGGGGSSDASEASAASSKPFKSGAVEKIKSPRMKAAAQEYQKRIDELTPQVKQLKAESNVLYKELRQKARADGVDIESANKAEAKASQAETQADFFEQNIGQVVAGRDRYDLTDTEQTKQRIQSLRERAREYKEIADNEWAKSEDVRDANDRYWQTADKAEEASAEISHMKERIEAIIYRDRERLLPGETE